jgi:hypothetical protein
MNSELIFRNNFKLYNINNMYETKNDYYFNKPNLNLVLDDNEYQTIYRTNDQGYRIGHTYRSENHPEWLFIGDSYTQGAQVNFNELFTSRLKEYYPQTKMLNAGISGFGLPEESGYLEAEGLEFKPKKIFLELCVLNDFEHIEPRKITLVDYLMSKSELFRFLFYRIKFEKVDEQPLGRWTDPFFSEEEDNINYNVLYTQSSPIKEKSIQNVLKYIDKIARASKKVNADLVVVLIPTKEQVYSKYYNEVVDKFKINEKLIDVNGAAKIIQKAAATNKFLFIDPLESFRTDTTMLYFEKDEHLNSNGHKKLAEIISKNVIP